MKIIKELYDNKKNVAIIIQPNDNEVDDIYTRDEKLRNKCFNYIIKNYFNKSETNKIVNCNYEFTMRFVSRYHILCYFNRNNNKTFENKIIKTILILNIDENQIDLYPDEPLAQIRKYGLAIYSRDDSYAAPFVDESIDMNDNMWSK